MKLSLIGVTALAVALVACTDEDGTRRTLDSAGYTEIQTTGYSWFECGKDDSFHTGFRAKNPAGKVVTGTVCCGFATKGCTIRF